MTGILLSPEKPAFVLSSQIPDSLGVVIERVWQCRYQELYEEAGAYNISLEEALNEVLKALETNNSHPSFCYFCMAIILGIAVQPTIRAYLPKEKITGKVFKWLVQGWLDSESIDPVPEIKDFFEKYLGQYQALDEAFDVFENLLQVLQFLKSKQALLEILNDCLEGYAIFPGSQGRRELFDWWLLEVVPSVFLSRFPEHIYTLKGSHQKNYQYLAKMRSYFWKLVRENRVKGGVDLEHQSLFLNFIAG